MILRPSETSTSWKKVNLSLLLELLFAFSNHWITSMGDESITQVSSFLKDCCHHCATVMHPLVYILSSLTSLVFFDTG